MSGDSFAVTLNAPGIYEYECTLHPGMVGTIIVTEAGSIAAQEAGSGAVPEPATGGHTEVAAAGLTAGVSIPSPSATNPGNRVEKVLLVIFGLVGVGFALYATRAFAVSRRRPEAGGV